MFKFMFEPNKLAKIMATPAMRNLGDAIAKEQAKPDCDPRKLTMLRAFAAVTVVYMDAQMGPDETLALCSFSIAACARRAAIRDGKPYEEALEAVFRVVRGMVNDNPQASPDSKAQA